MEQLSTFFNAIDNAIELASSSVVFVGELVAYIPAVIGSAIVIFLSAYVVRFALLK